MTIVDDLNNCTGCGLCFDKCPHRAIKMVLRRGFKYPKIANDKCTECGLCRKICPQNSYIPIIAKEGYAAYSKDENIRLSSSSGGIFTELSKFIIANGGIVFGVKYNEDWMPVFDYASTIEECEAFKVSKYAEARLEKVFPLISEKISMNQNILFTGLPCQVAAVKNRFPKSQNLITVELICKGVPSQKLFKAFIDHLILNFGNIRSINMRLKRPNWEKSSFEIDSKNNHFISGLNNSNIKSRLYDSYRSLFGQNLSLRHSCFNCKYRGLNRSGDLSIGDFWNINSIVPDMNDGNGTSIVLVNTSKGEYLLNSLDISLKEVNIEKVIYNRCIPTSSPLLPSKYNSFWNDFESRGYIYVAKKYTTYGTWLYMRHKLGNITRLIQRFIHC